MNYVTLTDVEFYDRRARLLGSPCKAYTFPENSLLPEKQIEWAYNVVSEHASSGIPYVVCTVSPYIVAAIQRKSNELNVTEDVSYIGTDGHKKQPEEFISVFSDALESILS